MLMRALGVAVLPLLAAQNCDLSFPTPTREQNCLAASRSWGVLGLAPEQVPEVPDRLLKAQLRVGESAALRATTVASPGECDDLVREVAWRSSAPEVAEVVPQGAREARLEARSPGETPLWADVTLQDGSARRAELYAIPAGRTSRLRVYAVTVTE
jgi:hypothetical protein